MVMNEDTPLCIGVCMTDPDSGYCLGCGRPPLPVTAADLAQLSKQTPSSVAPSVTETVSRTENPRVRGSIPRLATFYLSKKMRDFP